MSALVAMRSSAWAMVLTMALRLGGVHAGRLEFADRGVCVDKRRGG